MIQPPNPLSGPMKRPMDSITPPRRRLPYLHRVVTLQREIRRDMSPSMSKNPFPLILFKDWEHEIPYAALPKTLQDAVDAARRLDL
jgi:hypothetical protein